MFEIAQFLSDILFFAAHIRTKMSFPEPLTKEDEAQYIALSAQGDEKARHKLIVHNMRLVAHIAKKYSKSGLDSDDIISIGTIGLIKAVSTFNPEKGSLATYAARCIDNEILMSLRYERKRTANEVYLDEPVGHDSEGNVLTLTDKLGSDPDSIADYVSGVVFCDMLRGITRRILTERERVVIELRYSLNGGDRMSQREVSEFLGISRSYVSRIEKKALEKIKFELEKRQNA